MLTNPTIDMLRELGLSGQAVHLGHGRFLGHFGQAFDGDVAAVPQTRLQTAPGLHKQAVA